MLEPRRVRLYGGAGHGMWLAVSGSPGTLELPGVSHPLRVDEMGKPLAVIHTYRVSMNKSVAVYESTRVSFDGGPFGALEYVESIADAWAKE